MQPGPPPEDLHAILSRFHTWAGKNPPNGNGTGHAKAEPMEGIREVSYDEAIRRHRDRQASRSPRRSGPRAPSAPSVQSEKTIVPPPDMPEDLPSWIANLPVIPETEPVIALKAAPTPEQSSEPSDSFAAPDAEPVRPGKRHSSPTPPPSPPKVPPRAPRNETYTSRLLNLSAPPEPLDRSRVDPPRSSLPSQSRVQRAKAPALANSHVAAMDAEPRASAAPTIRPRSAPASPRAASAGKPPTPDSASESRRPAVKTRRHAGTAPRESASTLIRPAAVIAPRTPTQTATMRTNTPANTKPKARAAKAAQFSQVLATTVRQPQAALRPAKRPGPDRTRRITTRFSAIEERRIEKCAADLGITVSAYLRQCALAAATHSPLRETRPTTTASPNRKPSRPQSTPLATYSAPAPSLIGGWLALLRNRFLGPPIRFSEDA